MTSLLPCINGFFIFICLTTSHCIYASWFNRATLPTLPDEIDHTVAACQEDNLMLQCRNRYNKIIIKEAFYGRDNLFTCTSKIFNATKLCGIPTPSIIIQKVHLMCNNENKCKIPVTAKFLEKEGQEICPDIRKYLKVKYACHQNPQLHMVCAGTCSNTCWPMCQQSCCSPPPPPPPPALMPIMMQSPQQCGGGCPSKCSPLCQPTCCKSQVPTLSFMQNSVSSCPGSCSGSCLPLCDPTCCMMQKVKSTHQFNQPQPYSQVPPSCPGSCSSQCAPLCSASCCQIQNAMMMAQQPPPVLTCPGSCSPQCAPSCQQSCCQRISMMMAPPPPPPTCPGCSSRCAPLCQPTCCQSSVMSASPVMSVPLPPRPPPPMCPVGCPVSCLPMCQPTCCQQGGAAPPMMLPVMQAPPMIPMQLPQMPSQPVMMAPPPMPMMMPLQMAAGCSPMCSPSMCQPSCPPRCCVPNASNNAEVAEQAKVDPAEVQQRSTYQQMLTDFRKKQLKKYFHG